jgi:hypothetical protein
MGADTVIPPSSLPEERGWGEVMLLRPNATLP